MVHILCIKNINAYDIKEQAEVLNEYPLGRLHT